MPNMLKMPKILKITKMLKMPNNKINENGGICIANGGFKQMYS